MVQSALATLAFCRLRLRLNLGEWIVNLFLGVAFPLMLQVSFGQRLSELGRLRLMVGVLVLAGLLLSFRRTALALVAERDQGQTLLLAHAGLSKMSYVTGHAVEAAVRATLPLLFVLACVGLFTLPLARSITWIASYAALATLSFAAALLLVSLQLSAPAVALATNLIVVGSFVFCPVAYPADRLPRSVAGLISALPPAVASDLIWSSWNDGSQARDAFAAFSIGTMLALFFAVRRLAWPC